MSARHVLYGLLGAVAVAAAVQSFDALRSLAVLCGFSWWLAPLLPVTVDAGAAAGVVAWLGRDVSGGRRFGRWLALALLAASVAGNALGHALAAYSVRPHWLVVVAVSAVAPAVLGAVTHLAVLVGREPAPELWCMDEAPAALAQSSVPAARQEPSAAADTSPVEDATPEVEPSDEDGPDVAELISRGYGRARLARELDITPSQARTLIEQHRQPSVLNGNERH